MDSKALISNVVTAVVTAAVLGTLGFFMGVFEKGAEAMNRDQIEAVIDDYLVTPAGKTHSARIAEMNTEIATMETRIGILKEDLDEYEAALLDLTR